MKNIITFDQTAEGEVLEAFGLMADAEGFVVEKASRQRVYSSDGNPIEVKKFAGVKKGSFVFFNSDLPSLIELSEKLK